MMNIILSVPDNDADTWINNVSELEGIDNLEVSPASIADQRNFTRIVRKAGLQIRTIRELIPQEVGRNLESLTAEEKGRTVAALHDKIAMYSEEGVETVSLSLGLRNTTRINDEALEQRITFVRRLLTALESRSMQVLISVRYPPPYPGSLAWEAATNIVHDVMHPACRIRAEIYDGEIEDGFAIAPFVKSCAFHLGGLKFVYEPMLGETPRLDDLRCWLDNLQWHGYRGDIVFAPKVTGADAVRTACRKVAQYAQALHRG